MRGSVSPAVVAALYSVIVVGVALLMGRRAGRAPEADQPAAQGGWESAGGASVKRPFAGTGVALCSVALLIPLVRLIDTRALPDIALLLATMVLALVAMVYLMRPAETTTSAAPRAVTPRAVTSRPVGSKTAAARALAAARAAEANPSPVRSTALAGGSSPAPVGSTARATAALHEVDDVLGSVGHLLHLEPEAPDTHRSEGRTPTVNNPSTEAH